MPDQLGAFSGRGNGFLERTDAPCLPARGVQKAFDVQSKKLGFSFVEFVSTCPTNWGLSPIAAMDFLKEKMLPFYPLGVFKSPEGGAK